MNRTPASEVGGESVATLPPWPLEDLCKIFLKVFPRAVGLLIFSAMTVQ